MSPYVYTRSEDGLWTVGRYDSSGKWRPESDHKSQKAAATRMHYLNGGSVVEQCAKIAESHHTRDPRVRPRDEIASDIRALANRRTS